MRFSKGLVRIGSNVGELVRCPTETPAKGLDWRTELVLLAAPWRSSQFVGDDERGLAAFSYFTVPLVPGFEFSFHGEIVVTVEAGWPGSSLNHVS